MGAVEELQILEDILTALSDIPDISIFIELIKVRLVRRVCKHSGQGLAAALAACSALCLLDAGGAGAYCQMLV